MGDLAYYYCSVGTFQNIIKNHSLWMAEPRKQNDSEELSWFLNTLLPQLEIQKYSDPKLRFFINDCLMGTPWLFISCFSKDNGDKLSGWRGYGDDGQGFSIGFDLDTLVKKATFDNSQGALSKFDIVYANATLQDYVKKQVIRDLKAIDGQEWIPDAAKALTEIAIKYKNSAFREEKEIRLVYNSSKSIKDSLPHKYRTTSRDIIRYVEYFFDKSSIKEIVIGPRCNADELTVKEFLESLGYHGINVRYSSATYRQV